MLNKEQENHEKAMADIQEEIKNTGGEANDFEIEVTQDDAVESKAVEKESKPEKDDDQEYSQRVERRIKKLVDQRREVELQANELQEKNNQLEQRLARLEQGSQNQAENQFNQRYDQTKRALKQAVENGDTDAQVAFSEQLADMRAAMRIAELQKAQAANQAVSPTVGRAEQMAQTPPAPKKAMDWWERNRWFNSNGYERETAAARAIDVQLEVEGFDKEEDEYYDELNIRLQKVFPELRSGSNEPTKQRVKSRSPVAPTAGGSTYKGNRVRMSQDQLRMARELGITDEKGLKQYASEIQKQQRG